MIGRLFSASRGFYSLNAHLVETFMDRNASFLYTQSIHTERAKSALVRVIADSGGTWTSNRETPSQATRLLRDLAREGRVHIAETRDGEIICRLA